MHIEAIRIRNKIMKIRDTNSVRLMGVLTCIACHANSCSCACHCVTFCMQVLQTELYSMTEFAKEACKAAHNTLLVHCDQVAAGDVTLCMRILKQNETTVDQLCCNMH